MKKVSVMLPTYNCEEFIVECLESILGQNYDNIEIVICDDASTDATAVILQDFKSRYPTKINLCINETNLGITLNCNKALASCTGDYVSFFAGDDVMLPGKISEQVRMLDADDEASFCYHRVEIFDNEDGTTLSITEPKRTIFSFFDIIEKGGLPGANSVLAKRHLIPNEGYNIKIPAVSDWLFFIELALRGKIIFSTNILSKYRKHPDGCSAKADFLITETLETVELISRRFRQHPKIVSSCRKAKVRYLLGSIARLIKVNDSEHLARVNEEHVRYASIVLYAAVWIYVKSGLPKLRVGEKIFHVIKYTKSKLENGVGK
ncbi:glycosyltransferase [Pseudomonas sp. MIL19]|uniref:glycosyltransferase n=1 Tax=Pseudomonas sp. MIL19 TaxID=2976979 RepID=UPI002363448C|nr:glycosyltransferase [Pseudomonas sp. MIL19]MDD2162454.1 glycosyltransferase [Pseudomonas sp. MIL19]